MIHHLPLHGIVIDGSDVRYKCHEGEKVGHFMYRKWGGVTGERQSLPKYLQQSGMMDFHVSIQEFKLKMMIVGNSLSEQIFLGLQEAMCFDPLTLMRNTTREIKSLLFEAKTTTALAFPNVVWKMETSQILLGKGH